MIMKKSLCMMGFVALSLEAAFDERELENSFSFTADFAYFKREEGNNHKLIIDNSTTDCSCHYRSCDTKKLVHDFPFEPGFKVAVTYTTHHTVWDLSYLWLQNWEKECHRDSPGSLIFSVKSPGITYDFNGADTASAEYSSDFQNCELNYYRYSRPPRRDYFSTAYLIGLRYMSLRESLDVSFARASNRSSYRVHAMNRIPAFQVGGLFAWNPTKTITWNFVGMVGVGFDVGEQKTYLGDLNNTVNVRDYEEKGFSTPLVVEASIQLGYQPTSYLNIHAAYQFIYLNGVALAPDQLVKSNSTAHVYRAIGAPLYHGLTAGISLSF
jgi:hypothetical protein